MPRSNLWLRPPFVPSLTPPVARLRYVARAMGIYLAGPPMGKGGVYLFEIIPLTDPF